MHTKIQKFWLVGLLVIVSMLANVSGAAAFPEPPDGPAPAQPRGGTALGVAVTQGAEINAQAIALGKPGTVYRYEKTYGVSEQAFPWYHPGYFAWPHSVWVHTDGSVFISDPWAKAVRKYDANGNHLADFGHPGTETGWIDDGYFQDPLKMATDADGNLYVTDHYLHIVRILNPLGEQTGWIGDPGTSGTDDEHFNTPEGIFISPVNGQIYIADTYNHRIQVFDSDVNHLFTIGEAGVSGSDDNHLDNPIGVAVDDSGNIYVADTFNNRVMKYDADGDYLAQITDLEFPTSVAVDNTRGHLLVGVVYDAYVPYYNLADLSYAGAFGEFDVQGDDDTHFMEPHGVAVDEVGGKVYIADSPNRRVLVYSAVTKAYLRQFGHTNQFIPADDQHFFAPRVVEVEPNGSVILGEGALRLIKLNPDGSAAWTVGQSGFWGEPPDLVETPNGIVSDGKTVYAAMGCTIHKYSSADGTYLGVFAGGGDCWAPDSLFQHISDIARDSAGNIYVTDNELHRVTQLNKYGAVVASVGVRGEEGSDNAHFRYPEGIGLDKARNVYVADDSNCRVQKFDKRLRYVMTFTTTLCGDTHDRLGGPQDVVVDAKGKVFVADAWNTRIQIFDKSGAYLSTIGGSWGGGTGQLRVPSSLAMDKKGNLYVADRDNHRIQVYAPGVPYFGQQNLNGFGSRWTTGVYTVAMFKGMLYAGSDGEHGAQIWRKAKSGWMMVESDGFHNSAEAINHLFEYNGMLYAATYTYNDPNNGGQIWRTADGLSWQIVVNNGFDQGQRNPEVFRMMKLGNELCATTWSAGAGAQLWCSATGDSGSWEPKDLGGDGFGSDDNIAILDAVEYQDAWYASTNNAGEGAQVWRRSLGGTWNQVNISGFGDPDNTMIPSLVPFNGSLYAITHHRVGGSSEIWRCRNQCTKTSDWQFIADGENLGGDINYRVMSSLAIVGKYLVVVMGNPDLGLVVFTTPDGVTWWSQAGPSGMGNSGNSRIYYTNALFPYKGNLYMGVINRNTGGSVWKFCPTKKVCK
ncbi:NHL repeat-containing protein [Levilinea saccharolytica]|uniref:SMP-30/Gluconolactonase/LRE-like region domain-containing protein n=1 Tax=Levilinea saccharolytica TaxID=229921 RepID=A0A0P6XSE4_9CHLR|nr:NHL repeat-containing protein [Levilinea saccharolytica]KPL85811.1 hypothetical protein ADN01_05710 [Levilinea saccharolytica]GAP16731.1 gluconolactonase [Levilinea saccharolytica]